MIYVVVFLCGVFLGLLMALVLSFIEYKEGHEVLLTDQVKGSDNE